MRWVGLTAVLATLAACGGGEVGDAVAACKQAVESRVAEQMGQVDTGDMEAKAAKAADGNITITSLITFRAGTSDEGTQPYTCTVSTKNEKGEYELRIIGVQIDPLGYKKTGS